MAVIDDKEIHQPSVSLPRGDVSGELDRRIIRKVVKNHKKEIKACYERELRKIKDLHGKVVVKWTIDSQGDVQSAIVTSTTMKNDDVDSCLTKAILHWQFPKPKRGGLTMVSYPFVFELGG